MDQSVLYHWHEDFREEAKVLAEVLTVDPSQASALFLSCIFMWERALFRTWLKLFLHAFMCGDVSTTWVRGDDAPFFCTLVGAVDGVQGGAIFDSRDGWRVSARGVHDA